jgi:hypothetical protein
MKGSRIGRQIQRKFTSKTHLRYDTTILKIRFNDNADGSNAYELQNTSLAPFQFVTLMLSIGGGDGQGVWCCKPDPS